MVFFARFAVLMVSCCLVACANVGTEGNDFDPPPPSAQGDGGAPNEPRDDGAPCAHDSDCSSGVCVPVLPKEVEQRGVCWGPGMPSCLWVLIGEDEWSQKPCRDIGMTDMLCPPVMSDKMKEACVVPTAAPSGTYPYEYICCETTFTE